jgi:hypothetical protein
MTILAQTQWSISGMGWRSTSNSSLMIGAVGIRHGAARVQGAATSVIKVSKTCVFICLISPSVCLEIQHITSIEPKFELLFLLPWDVFVPLELVLVLCYLGAH